MTVGDLVEAGMPRLFGAGHTKPKTATNDLPTYVSKVALSILCIVQPKIAGHIYALYNQRLLGTYIWGFNKAKDSVELRSCVKVEMDFLGSRP